MPKKRLFMRKLVDILRLSNAGMSERQIARACNVSRSTVASYLKRLAQVGVRWPLPLEMGEEELNELLFTQKESVRSRDKARSLPDWAEVGKELMGKGVTLRLLWEEYRQTHVEGYEYSQFCVHYRRWLGDEAVCLRQSYKGGERLFVDFAGMTMPVKDGPTGEVREAQIFVAALGASHYLYAEALASQKLHDWIEAHVHLFDHLGGVPEIVVPDNLKSGVSKACRYEPVINPTYQDMALHYGVAIIPARPVKPRDKAKVETGVQIVEREVLAPLRHQTFFSLCELNAAMRKHLEAVNIRPFQKLKTSRKELFEELDKPALKPLPVARYDYAELRVVRVNIDYHIEVDGHYYSVPYDLKKEELHVRVSARMVEVLRRGRRVAAHPRDTRVGRHTTDTAHMPRAHREYLAWTPSRIIEWAGKIGPDCAGAVEEIVASRQHPEQGYRSALGLIRLAKDYTDTRVNAACRRARTLDLCNYQSIKSMLRTGKDQDLSEVSGTGAPAAHHANVRGAGYYSMEGQVEHAE